ncbi:hypothetical protein ACIQTW_12115 [Paenarthrobacter sp. NPDC090517]|uniref:hypothetical protein n=1 Tax=Paenarthrobacter sp. NPDC090517 TaxID=3364381 RepID=UPI0038119A3A
MGETRRDELVGTWTYSAEESTVGSPVPSTTIELRSDDTVTVVDFPADQLTETDFAKTPLSATGTWEFLSKLPEGFGRYGKQAGIQLDLPATGSSDGTYEQRLLVIEKKDDEAPRLVIYVGHPDTVGKDFVLTKGSSKS